MTARGIFKQCVYNPTPAEGKEYQERLFRHTLSNEITKHLNTATIEGESVYLPKAIRRLKYEMAATSPALFGYWCDAANGKPFTESNLGELLDYVDAELARCGDDRWRKRQEEKFGHELFYFFLDAMIVNRLQARLDAIGDERSNEKKSVALELLHALKEDVYWKSTTIDTPNKGVVKCTDESWLALCGLLPKTDDHRIEWLVEKNGDRSAMPLAELLIDMFGETSAQDKIGLFVDHRGKMIWDNNYKRRHQEAKSFGTTNRNVYFRDIHPQINLILQRWNDMK